jgi:hypothetical protein
LGIGGDAWGCAGVGTKPAGSGGWNVPPGKDLAVIEVTSGSSKLARPSHFAAAAAVGTAATAPSRTAEHDSILNPLVMISLPFVFYFFGFLHSLLRRTTIAWQISGHRYRTALAAPDGCALRLPRKSRCEDVPMAASASVQARGNKMHASGAKRHSRQPAPSKEAAFPAADASPSYSYAL